jgi:uncharacterized protein (DUF1499 family)
MDQAAGGHPMPRWAWGVLALSVAALVLPVAAGMGARFGAWHFGVGFALLKADVYLAVAAALVAAVALGLSFSARFRGAWPVALAALMLPLFPLATILGQYHDARTLPRIHDITTDTQDPPGFSAVVPLRPPGANSLTYGGPELAAQQAAAYPDIGPIYSRLTPDRAFELAKALVHGYGWKPVREDPANGVIEAVDTTFWFGFKDDVSIRVRPREGGSVVDIRSVSRAGVSDVGTNARRIRRFIRDFQPE